MKKCLILLLVIALMTTLIGCSDKKPNKESVVKSETETGISNDNIECSFKAVVTEVSDDVYEDTTSDNLNSNVGIDNLLDSIIMASSDIDIDEDGRTEYCTITPGPTSGLFTVTITVYRENAIQYKNTFNLNWGEMKFGEKDGENYLIITRNGELQEYGVEYHKIYVESGRIVIDGLDPKYEGYWGGPDWNYDLK